MDFNGMKYFSMFSGIGGFELGIQYAYDNLQAEQPAKERRLEDVGEPLPDPPSNNRAATSCIGYSEIDKYAIKVYERQFKHDNYGDATAVNPDDLPDFDLLVGGFPCQAFSVAGKRGGFADPRGTLFFDILRIAGNKRPAHLVLENVKGLLSHDSGETFKSIIGLLSDAGYRVEWQVLNSKDFGVPQNRERVFIVGHLRGECGGQVFPITRTGRQNAETGKAEQASRSWVSTLDSRYGERWSTETYVRPKVIAWSKSHRTSEQERYRKNWGETEYRVRVDEGFNTLSAGEGGGNMSTMNLVAEKTKIRRLTPKECERLQGFPDDWTAGESDTQRYKMCGNAVTTNVVAAVIGSMKNCLDTTS